MKVEFLHQPTAADQQRLGRQLRSLLEGADGQFTKFNASIAFVKASGASRIYKALQKFRSQGGTSRVAVGIDRRGTSKQGLEILRQVVDEIFVYHDRKRTFHPKIYVLQDPGVRAVILLGSGNLTGGGLFTNYEGHVRFDLNLKEPQDSAILTSLLSFCDQHCDNKSPCVVSLTDESLIQLADRLLDETLEEDTDGAEDEAVPIGSGTPSGSREKRDQFGSILAASAPPPDVPLPRKKKGTKSTVNIVPVGPAYTGSAVLIAEIPRASDRWNQANFHKSDFTGFFRAHVGTLQLRHVRGDGSLGTTEVRPGVSVKSRNFRIELGAAAGLAYPKMGRPIGFFVRTAPRTFLYMLLMPGTAHYKHAQSILAKRSHSRKNRTKTVGLRVGLVRTDWPDSPLWQHVAST